MKLIHALLKAGKAYKDKGRMDIYRSAHPEYVFTYVPEYSEKTEYTWNDINVWRHGIGSFAEMVLPEEWLDKEDWEVYE